MKATLRVHDRHAELVVSDIHDILLDGAPTMQWMIYRTIEGSTPPQPSPPIRAAKFVQPLIGRIGNPRGRRRGVIYQAMF